MSELFEIALRLVVEFVLWVLVRGPVFLIAKWLRPEIEKDTDQGCFVFIVGLAFWATVAALVAILLFTMKSST